MPYEFHQPQELPPLDALEMTPPPTFQHAHASVPPGTWSDDGAQALALLASLLECRALDLADLGRRFVAWYETGYLAVDHTFDTDVSAGAFEWSLNDTNTIILANHIAYRPTDVNNKNDVMEVDLRQAFIFALFLLLTWFV